MGRLILTWVLSQALPMAGVRSLASLMWGSATLHNSFLGLYLGPSRPDLSLSILQHRAAFWGPGF
ncbi:rCG63204 [Rattus norvegicus]|uniref:RCG63204 n=1 Tax=Rattus norvegicus TaxID=10116 RepID=A6IA72_RAT|nr:rCG63204 [Rattus norvegicus]